MKRTRGLTISKEGGLRARATAMDKVEYKGWTIQVKMAGQHQYGALIWPPGKPNKCLPEEPAGSSREEVIAKVKAIIDRPTPTQT